MEGWRDRTPSALVRPATGANTNYGQIVHISTDWPSLPFPPHHPLLGCPVPPPRDTERFLPLKTDALLVLIVLQAQPRHGYGIMRDVEQRSHGETVLQTGALYRLLKRLLGDGLIEEIESTDDGGDERRRLYRTSALGAAVLTAEADRMERLVREARSALPGRRPRLA